MMGRRARRGLPAAGMPQTTGKAQRRLARWLAHGSAGVLTGVGLVLADVTEAVRALERRRRGGERLPLRGP